MKFTATRESILKPLQHVIGVVERRQTLPVLANVLVAAEPERIGLTATDLEVELVAEVALDVEGPGEITLPARKLLDICRTLPEGAELSVSVSGEKAQLRSGRSRFTLSTLAASEFPSVEEINVAREFTVPQRDLKRLIERTQFSMAQQDVRYYLNGLMLELEKGTLRSVATDGHRLALCELEGAVEAGEAQQVIVPRKGVQELARLLEDTEERAQVQLGSNHVRIQLAGLRFTSKLIDGRFPDYQRVVPQDTDRLVSADRETLRQALVRTSILSNEKYRGVRLQLDNGRLRIQAHNPEHEEAEEEIEVDYQGGELEIGFNVNYILDALNVIPGEQVRLSMSDPNSSCLIEHAESKDCRYVVMPMRL
ncbi:MAG: DNA polymerase III subunit beta [Gammaproteobacteria bacterium]|nr:DNA polymerase III subunit beta [Gammaproteobacteria bacterium]NIR98075.1 DNA polymerase III subunit beta [Gammaproteobacteria bacterium]NIT63413.1 DNA polymerase III subunit beta [Gammaproteobacteria bacterium]NIV20320.1 DNA polymerase III subunit beta [Gammaproteobacteria bacterium]NIX10797.1 DNA polymerase III subunit beta [Gammaproteobacteria bacterium]